MKTLLIPGKQIEEGNLFQVSKSQKESIWQSVEQHVIVVDGNDTKTQDMK